VLGSNHNKKLMQKTIIIAEAGVNHNGDIELAKKLIDVAAKAGVDYVKFQTFKAESLVSKQAKQADYQIQNIGERSSQLEMLKKLELSIEDHHALKSYCKTKDIKFLSTAFDLESLDFLEKLGIDLFKVPSGEITNAPYLEKIATYNKSVVLSTGMADIQEISEAIQLLTKAGLKIEKITVLHCNTEYPTPMEDVNLSAMNSIKSQFRVPIGYSDHTLGIEIPIAAVALGATIIEKHFTLDRNLPGPDHKASLEPEELIEMVRSIRNIEVAMGNGTKSPSASEIKNKIPARKSIHIKTDIAAGHILQTEDLIMKRPGDGISPMKYHEIIGKKIKRSLTADHKLLLTDLQ